MQKDTQSRKWQITINNPVDKGFTHNSIKDILSTFKSCVYYCFSDEIGEEGTYHTHIYMCCSSAVRFSTIQNKFGGGHYEMAKGTSQENRDYVYKEGKWEKDKKKETNLPDTHEEWGDLPVERQGKRNDIDDLYDMIKSGMSDYEILESCPNYMLQLDKVERVRQTVREDKYKNEWRTLSVTYVWGETGTGKTRMVMEKYGYANVYRVTDYDHPFDGYRGQEIIAFEEFRSDLKIGDMLKYLDGYPLSLGCRYLNKQACYTTVYILTNVPLSFQYRHIQEDEPRSYQAFLRRINEVHHYTGHDVEIGCIVQTPKGYEIVPKEDIPFPEGDEN